MKYLLDTHILIWLAVSPNEIPKHILEILENVSNNLYVSTVSLWEIAIKLSVKKLDLRGLEISDLIQICLEQDIRIVQLPVSSVVKYKNLPNKAKS